MYTQMDSMQEVITQLEEVRTQLNTQREDI